MTGNRDEAEPKISRVADREAARRREKGLEGLAEFVRLGQAVQKKADRILADHSKPASPPKGRA